MKTYSAAKPSLFGLLLALCALITLPLHAQFDSGEGTENNPYVITTADHLNEIRNYLEAHFVLGANINLGNAPWNQEAGWEPIGNSSVVFEGSLDGNGFSIQNLKINRPDDSYVGLFGYLRNAKISRLHLEAVNIIGSTKTGALSGYIYQSQLHEITVSGQLQSDRNEVGGLTGNLSNSAIYQVHTNVQATGDKYIGALAGACTNSSIRHSSSAGSVTGNAYLGGLLGSYNGMDEAIASAISYADVTASGENQRAVGGFLGFQQTGSIVHAISLGQVSASTETAGAFLGELYTGIQVRCLFNNQNSGISSSAGVDGGVIGYNNEELKDRNELLDFDFSRVWSLNGPNGFPAIQVRSNTAVSQPDTPTLEGNGTAEAPFLVYEAADLLAMEAHPTAYYRLMNDIDLSQSLSWNHGKGFKPIYPSETNGRFKGVLDGNGYSINNLVINRPREGSTALFAYLQDATITNLHLNGVQITGASRVAGLVGDATNSVFEEVHISGDVFALQANAGGIAYRISGGNVHRASFSGYVYAENTAGGAFSSVSIGALLRKVSSKGGVYWHGYGSNESSKGRYMGGLIGHYNGGAYHDISDCYSLADVYGRDNLGGLIGHVQTGSLTKCYAAGEVVSETGVKVGGLVGANDHGFAENCYWDTQTTLQNTSAFPYGAKGLTTVELQSAQLLKNWNFISRWEIKNAGRYPTFKENELHTQPAPTPLAQLQGDGTENSPYLIRSAADLLSVNLKRDAYYRLNEDLDLSETENWNYGLGWNSLATDSDPFTGYFDGNGHSIKGLFISRGHQNYQGLFARLSDAQLLNLRIHDSILDVGHRSGVFLGEAINETELDGLRAYAHISGTHSVGGVVGQIYGGEFHDSEFIGTVQGLSSIGGLAGYSSSHIKESSSIGSVEFALFEAYSTYGMAFGGLVGTVNGSMIENAYSRANVNGQERVGGLVGYIQTGSIYNSYAAGSVIHNEASLHGGLIGHSSHGRIYDSYWDTDRTGQGQSEAGYARSHDEMRATDQTHTYGAWNFNDVWVFDRDGINDDLPLLRVHAAQTHTLAASAQAGGQVSGAGTYRHGSMIQLQAIPEEGQALEYWMEDGEVISTSPTLQFSLMADRSISAHFGVLTNVDEPQDQMPTTVELLQNYPNPFNPSTTIELHLDQNQWIELNVYNIMGQRVQTLASGAFSSGVHRFTFDGMNLSSGVYLYRLQTPTTSITRKMLLIK